MGDREMKAVLVGNPGVGKSAIFDSLTGLNCALEKLPGIYSLDARSAKGNVARQYLCSGKADVVVVVSDAACLESGLHLLKEILSLEPIRDRGVPMILCVSLCDKAEKKGIGIDLDLLRDVLQFPVISCRARRGEDLAGLKEAILECGGTRGWYDCLDFSPRQLAGETVRRAGADNWRKEEMIDKIVTGRFTGSLLLVTLLMSVFWVTVKGAVYFSGLLWSLFFSLENELAAGLSAMGAPNFLAQAAIFGVYRASAWTVSVMLPPAAIFFWLFTLLEDSGYLSRVAFCMDRPFKQCQACGGQCLTMAMSLGCGAAGVAGCRTINSPKERLAAMLTNSLVPCSGRLPTLLTLITLFLIPGFCRDMSSVLFAALFLTVVVVTGAIAAMACSWLLSCAFLKNLPSAYTLELPPYRRPRAGKLLVSSLLDRTVPAVGRAAGAAAFAGLAVWLLANWFIGGRSALLHLTAFLDPAGRLMGLDGVILIAFFMGFPAGEMVVPIMLMAYLSGGFPAGVTDASVLRTLLADNGWTWKTALCTTIFCVFHWPCLAACRAVRRETESLRWTAAAIAVPTILGVILCAVVNGMMNL